MKQLNTSVAMPYRKAAQLVLATLLLFAATAANSQGFHKLYDFGTNPGDPQHPNWSGVFAQGRDGNLYSTSLEGGIGYGTVFQLTPAGAVTVLYQFPGANSQGGKPSSGLTLGTDGYLYGATQGLGAFGFGSIFKIATDGTPPTTLYSFTNGDDGEIPWTAPIQGLDGNFYGTTSYGHHGTAFFRGSVYKMTPKGILKTLYQFDDTHGAYPTALMQGTDGNFYGTTKGGGTGPCSASCGVIFKITAAGKLTVLHNFDGSDGNSPYGPIIQATDGNFYGTTLYGGSSNFGVVYQMTPAGVLKVLFNFERSVERPGTEPYAGLVQATDGKFYGSAQTLLAGDGVLYQITSAGDYTDVYTCTRAAGTNPRVSMIQNTNGLLYGDTSTGGAHEGVAYSLDMGLGPFVKFVPAQSAGKVGKSIGILGQGLTGTSHVSFDGVSATFKVVSDTYLTTKIPAEATSGVVTVTTPGGTLASNQDFRVVVGIRSFSPSSGPVGTTVTITGNSLTGATKITVGGVKATSFTVNSDTQVTATVPTNATTGKIAITTPNGTATSYGVFTVTP